ncbi:MAG: glycosyltransferase [Cyanobacteria bacterium J06632_22]
MSNLDIAPLVSVILVVRNGERYVAEAIDSVLASDYPRLELVIIDGQSSDRTSDIVQSYVQRYSNVRSIQQHNLGISNAYNLGLQSVKGEFVAFISHDDCWMPQKLSQQMDYLLHHPEVQFTVTQFRYCLAPGCQIPSGFRPELLTQTPVGYIMETLVARKSVFDIVGTFNPDYLLAEDVDWYARAKDLKVPSAVIPTVLLSKRVHDNNASANAQVSTQALLKVLRQSIQRQNVTTAPRETH